MKLWIGIDPGKTGAICVLSEDGSTQFFNNSSSIANIVTELTTLNKNHKIRMCMIEDVHAVFGSSSKSTFNFGFGVGFLHGVFQTLGLPLDSVQPKVWQKHIGVKGTVKGKEIKLAVADIVSKQNPQSTQQLYTERGRLIDGRSDALALAIYARFKHP